MDHSPQTSLTAFQTSQGKNIFPSTHPCYQHLAKLLAMGLDPLEACVAANIKLPDFEEGDDYFTQDDTDFAHALSVFPPVASLVEAHSQDKDAAYAMSVPEKRAFLRAAVFTPPSAIGADSPLCQSYTVTPGKFGDKIEVKCVDKLRAMDMDSKLAGHNTPEEIALGASQSLTDLITRIRKGQPRHENDAQHQLQ